MVRGATRVVPFSIEVRASSALSWYWRRVLQPTVVELRERLIVKMSRDDGASFEAYCETPWTDVAQLGGASELRLETDARTLWRVEVYEENRTPTVTILDEERPTLALMGPFEPGARVTPTPLPSGLVEPPDKNATPPGCDITEQAQATDAIPAATATIPKGGLRIAGDRVRHQWANHPFEDRPEQRRIAEDCH